MISSIIDKLLMVILLLLFVCVMYILVITFPLWIIVYLITGFNPYASLCDTFENIIH